MSYFTHTCGCLFFISPSPDKHMEKVNFLLFCPCTFPSLLSHTSFLPSTLHNHMKQLSAHTKHHILLEYRPRSPTHSFSALAAAHGVAGGADVVRHWHTQWDGTPQSLERKRGQGRPRVLSRAQVTRHVKPRILAANRNHRPIHYSHFLSAVQTATGKKVSLPTLQRYGHEQAGARQTRGKKRTAEESECTHTRISDCLLVLLVCGC